MLNIEKLDEEKISNGVWVDYNEEISLKIASPRSQEYKDALSKAAKKLPKNSRTWTAKQLENLNFPLIARYILVDWKGITDTSTGKPWKYSVENAEKLLREYVLIQDFVKAQMESQELFIEEFREDAVKN